MYICGVIFLDQSRDIVDEGAAGKGSEETWEIRVVLKIDQADN